MNHICRSIWNEKTGTLVAASENAKSDGNKSSPGATAVARGARFALKGLAVSLMLASGSSVYALPTGGTVALAAGNAVTLDVAGDRLLNVTVTQGTMNALVQSGRLIRPDGGQVRKFDRPVRSPRDRKAGFPAAPIII